MDRIQVSMPFFDVEGPVLGEVFLVYADASGINLAGPHGPAAWQLEVPADEDPMTVVRDAVTNTLGAPLLVHSTSWRRDKAAVVLSFVAVVKPEQVAQYQHAPVARADLGRGIAAGAEVTGSQVLEHGIRHLAWLAHDEDVVTDDLDESWQAALANYTPAPFRIIEDTSVGAQTLAECGCGFRSQGTEDQIVLAMVEHVRQVHNMEATREQVLSISRPA